MKVTMLLVETWYFLTMFVVGGICVFLLLDVAWPSSAFEIIPLDDDGGGSVLCPPFSSVSRTLFPTDLTQDA